VKKKGKKITFSTAEIDPFSKVGGLADVMGALPDELEKLGCTVSVVTPLYSSIDRRAFGIEPLQGMEEIKTVIGGKDVHFGVYSCLKPGTGVRVYFIDNQHYYQREGVYNNSTGEAFEDEDERTVFLNRAVIELIKALDLYPDIIHCNDFHTGLIPAYLELEENQDIHFKNTGTVFSVHNLAYQGIFEKDFMIKAGFDPQLFKPLSPFEFWGKVNVMKIGLFFADMLSTVSETYAEEITTTDEYGYGLEGVLLERKDSLVGIPNGIDMDKWNPGIDELIPANYSVSDLDGKQENKRIMLEEFGLKAKGEFPVVGMVSRLVDQKGLDILSEAFDDLMELDVQFVILGTGQAKYHDIYSKLSEIYTTKLGFRLEFNEKLAHLVEAGSDFFIMPSKYEPCGLNQMYSLRYGTIPIVRATGGLRDTIDPLTPRGGRGNGFIFEQYSAEALYQAIREAVGFYNNERAMRRVRKRIMKEDHSWLKSARGYLNIYNKVDGKSGIKLTK
jgi:starch synthase